MLTIQRTNNENPDFAKMLAQLDAYLWLLFGNKMEYFSPLNVIEKNNTVVLAYYEGAISGCGCLRQFDSNTIEVKRMFVIPEKRGVGIATAVLQELELWAKELGYHDIILETGTKLTAAVELYKKQGYVITENWGPYIGVEGSICMKKAIK